MLLTNLTALVDPPDEAIGVPLPEDFAVCESELGLALPSDFKELCQRFPKSDPLWVRES
jgi:hypothetical protein